uniref:Uncharacterized protein n=1 Tax=Anopheles coluzzii TaxID=1518534 RepID=A0A8W7P096_ANOCL
MLLRSCSRGGGDDAAFAFRELRLLMMSCCPGAAAMMPRSRPRVVASLLRLPGGEGGAAMKPCTGRDTFDYYDRYEDPRDLFERRYGIRGRDFPPMRREPMPPIPPLMRRSVTESSRASSSSYEAIFSRRTPPPASRNGTSSISRFGVYEDFSRDSFDDRRGLRGPSPTHRYAPY